MAINTLLAPPQTESPVSTERAPRQAEPNVAPGDAVPDDLVLWRMSVKQYHAIARAGIIDEDEPVELLEGLLVQKMTKKPPHTAATLLTMDAFRTSIPSGWFMASQEPVTLADSEPEPDVMVVRGVIQDFFRRHPGPADVALVVEVADATLRRDRGTKKRIYARGGILVYWLINLINMCIEVYTNPTGPISKPDYLTQQVYHPGDELPLILAGEEIAKVRVESLLPLAEME